MRSGRYSGAAPQWNRCLAPSVLRTRGVLASPCVVVSLLGPGTCVMCFFSSFDGSSGKVRTIPQHLLNPSWMCSLAGWLNAVMQLLTEGSGPLRDPRKLSQLSGVVVGGGTISSPPCPVLAEKTKAQRGTGSAHHPPRSATLYISSPGWGLETAEGKGQRAGLP